MATTPDQPPGTDRIYPYGYCLVTFAGYGACILAPDHEGDHQDANGHTFTAVTPHAIFGELTRKQVSTLMDYIGDAVHACAQVAELLRQADVHLRRRLDVPHHELAMDLSELHSELFSILCPDSPAALR